MANLTNESHRILCGKAAHFTVYMFVKVLFQSCLVVPINTTILITRISGRIRGLEKLAAPQGFASLRSAFFASLHSDFLRLRDFVGVYVNLCEFTGICTILCESAPVCVNLREFAQICASLRESARVCANLREFARICASLRESARVCANLREFGLVWFGLASS